MTSYAITKLLIKRGRTDGLAEKVNSLYLLGQLTEEQYTELMSLLGVSDDSSVSTDTEA